jgi:hypothetical protein
VVRNHTEPRHYPSHVTWAGTGDVAGYHRRPVF